MKLWEAILKGCEGTYQVFNMPYDGLGGSCALGAAKDGGYRIGQKFILMKMCCPACGYESEAQTKGGNYPAEIRTAIVCLNNNHKWTREAIAEWVKTIEENAILVTRQVDEKVSDKQLATA